MRKPIEIQAPKLNLPANQDDAAKRDWTPDPYRPGNDYRILTVQMITPLFGGGVEAGKNDPISPVSGKAIRGHLRFWWRATRGGMLATTKELREREAAIFGDTQTASRIHVHFELDPKCPGQPIVAREWVGGREQPQFPLWTNIVFPFVLDRNENCLTDLRFRLHISRPSGLEQDLDAALWAWLNFGGIGSRTRRGCGALSCTSYAIPTTSKMTKVKAWFEEQASKYIDYPPEPRPWPTMGRLWLARHVSSKEGSAALPSDVAWQNLVEPFYEFRQGDGFGRSGRFGASNWPEANTIRTATTRGEQPAVNGFPRASFGLPIIFHFLEESPGDTTLLPLVNDSAVGRMASPLILRPLRAGDGTFLSIAHLLCASPLEGALLRWSDSQPVERAELLRVPSSRIVNPDFSKEQNGILPMKEAEKKDRKRQPSPQWAQPGNAVHSFLVRLCNLGFEELYLQQ